MATTDMNDDEKAYLDAFNEDAPAAAGPTEDAEFGTSEAAELPAEPVETKDTAVMSEDAGNANDGEDASVTVVMDGGDVEQEVQAAGAKDSAEAASDVEPVVAVEDEAAPKAMDMDKEVQRLKSWEGRLKAMEAKLKAAGADTPEEQTEAVAEAIEKAADATDTPADEEKVEQIAEQVEEGSISPEQAMKQLAEDFGDDFVRMIEAIATAKAREAGTQVVGELKGTVDEIIGDIVDSKAKAHFERIAEAHPDFNEIGESEEFKTYIESLPDDQKGAALETIAGGSAKQIVKLLDGFKAANKAGGDAAPELTEAKESIVDEVSDDMLDAAEGVRSSGMKLPEQPQKSDDYASAWDQF
jgi:hypothetical protein